MVLGLFSKKTKCAQVCQEQLNPSEAQGDSFLNHIINSDKTYCHNCKTESKEPKSMEW